MYNCIQLDSIYVAFRFPTKPTAPCSLVPVFLGQRRPLIDPSIPSSRQPPTIYLLLVVVVVFSKPPNLPILILWILNLHIIMCPIQSTVILFFVSLVHRCLLDKKRFRTPFLTLQNHFEKQPSIGLNFLEQQQLSHICLFSSENGWQPSLLLSGGQIFLPVLWFCSEALIQIGESAPLIYQCVGARCITDAIYFGGRGERKGDFYDVFKLNKNISKNG